MNVVLLSYGNRTEYNRALFALLSFWAWNRTTVHDVRIVLYTDNQPFFEKHLAGIPVTYKPITAQAVGDINAVSGCSFRVKIHVVESTLNAFPDSDLFYLDTDAFFSGDIASVLQSISAGCSIMDEPEFTFEEFIEVYRWDSVPGYDAQQSPRNFVKLIESKQFSIGNEPVKFHRKQIGWNAGILGMSKNMRHCIKDVFTLADEFYHHTQWRISEQLAFTVVLGHLTKLKPSGENINHYWHYKDRVDARLQKLFTLDFDRLSFEEKLEQSKALSRSMNALLHHEKMVTSTKRALREKQLGAGLAYATKALTSIPLNRDFVEILKYRVRQYAAR